MTLRWSELEVRLGERSVLTAVHLEARPGELLAVVGPNGAGKSTLLRSGIGILRPWRGRVELDGRSVDAWPLRARARRIGYVPQRAHLDYPFTVREAVSMARYAHVKGLAGLSPDDRRAVEEALAAMELHDLAERRLTTLSGGERQRVAVARGLAQDPDLLLLDEPTAGLDLGHAHRTLSRLRGRRDERRGVVVVLHDVEAATRWADRLVLVGNGRVMAEGPPRQVVTPERLGPLFGAPLDVAWNEDGARVRVVEAP